ncbi:MAG: caspase family protein [Bacteroidia bacterium]|nr:caspase family protein [Bacteroidia bacterium]
MKKIGITHSITSSLLALLLLSAVPGFSQDNRDARMYGSITSRELQHIFLDEFEDNRHKWSFGTSYLNERILDGDYYIASLADYPYDKRRNIPLNYAQDYEVELRIRMVKTLDDYQSAGMILGRDIQGSGLYFQFNGAGQFRIGRTDRGKSVDMVTWKYSNLLSSIDYNTLTLRRVGTQWYFFINKQLVHQCPTATLPGTEFGFSLDGQMAIEADYLRVSQIRSADVSAPVITLSEPILSSRDTLYLTDRRQVIRGRVTDATEGVRLTINSQPITLSAEGNFSASLSIQDIDAITMIRIDAIDRYDNSSQKIFYLKYAPAPAPAPAYVTKPQPRPISSQVAQPATSGKSYLLLIGINNYQNWSPLHNAVKDCQDLAATLTAQYQFEQENVISLFNTQATRENILETLESLQERVGPDDNLLIYYAGHGFYDDVSSLGYWVPVDARLNKIPDFIHNSTVHDYLRTINSKHTFLIADACYAGSLFTTYRSGTLSEDARSRWAFTSGDIEKVWDGQPGQNSPFAKQLIRYLRNNSKDRLPANELIQDVGYLVHQSTAQSPQGNPLKLAGDDGGVFVFVRRAAN